MNGPEFFMQHAGYKLLPAERHTNDSVKDANTLLSMSLALHTGKTLRLSSCWMVVTPHWVATSFKASEQAGFRQDMERKVAIDVALKSCEPCLLLALGKRTMEARDLFVTYDPRAARLCSEGSVKTFDATKEKTWTS
jgi:hypothetical protein